MNKTRSLSIRLELIWWLATIVVLCGVLIPIYTRHPFYEFMVPNIVFIVVAITFARYLFLLKHTWLGYVQWAKAVLFFICIPLFIYQFDRFNAFKFYVDIGDLMSMFEHLPVEEQTSMVNYVRSEMTFFGVASLIVTAILPFRMLISFWRTHNRGTV